MKANKEDIIIPGEIPWGSIFTPRSVAVIGKASLGKGGWLFLRALKKFDYKGEVYCVDEDGPGEFDVKWVPHVEDLPWGIEYAIVCVKAKGVPDVLRGLAKKGVKVAHIFSSGFAELKTIEGKSLQKEISEITIRTGIRIIGPNCVGPFCPKGGIAPTPGIFPSVCGNVGFISQSGSITQSLIWSGHTYGFYMSKAISVGNCVDLDVEDFMQHMADEADIDILAAYLEGLDDFRQFFDVVSATAPKKPVILLKTGKTTPGLAAIGSHTASLSGDGIIWDHAMRQAGAILVDTYEELVHSIQAFAKAGPVSGPRIGLMNRGGGEGIIAVDYLSMLGFEIPEYSKDTQAKLGQYLPSSGTSVANPLDFAAIGGFPNVFGKILEIAASDRDIDVILYQHHVEFCTLFGGEEFNKGLLDALIDVSTHIDKPVFVIAPLYYSYDVWYRTIKCLNQADIPVFPTLESGAKALLHMVEYYTKRGTKLA
jgi:acyl-CoA synthetase (NDP forming)